VAFLFAFYEGAASLSALQFCRLRKSPHRTRHRGSLSGLSAVPATVIRYRKKIWEIRRKSNTWLRSNSARSLGVRKHELVRISE
jgi:hypothetical protein